MDAGLSRHRPTVAVVDLDRIAKNFRFLRGLVAPGSFFCPMVKANAYGHGDLFVVSRLRREGARHVGVGLIEEGIHLRAGGDDQDILNFGLFDSAGAQALWDFHLTPVISTLDGLRLWRELAEKNSAREGGRRKIHIKVNTGMNRLGISMVDLPKVFEIVRASPFLEVEGVATHCSDGEDMGEPSGRTAKQIAVFRKAVDQFTSTGLGGFQAHLANSAVLLRASDVGLLPVEWGARPGISLYGLENQRAGFIRSSRPELQPAMKLKSRIVHIQDVGRDDRVSYGGRWTAKRPSRIAVIPCGYADGYRRGFEGAEVYLEKQNRRAPVVGTVCMDYFMCDLTDVESVQVGDIVELFGDHVSVDELSDRIGTISYEVLTGVSERVPRLYVDGPSMMT